MVGACVNGGSSMGNWISFGWSPSVDMRYNDGMTSED